MASKKKMLKADKFVRKKKSGSTFPVESGAVTSILQSAPAALKPFPIIGLDASAGGLEALEKFFGRAPADGGMAFVVVTHLHPGHVSLLPELLGKCTRMRVMAAADGMAVEPNTVYMSLPDGYLAILDVASANAAFHRAFKTSARKVEERLIYELGDGRWNLPAPLKLLEEVLPRHASFEDFRVRQEFSGLGRKTPLLNARGLKRESGTPEMILLTFEDVTARREAAKKPRRRRKDSVA